MARDLEELTQALREEEALRPYCWIKALILLTVWGVLMGFLTLFGFRPGNGLVGDLWGVVSAIGGMFILGYSIMPTLRQREAAIELATLNDIHVIVPLIRAFKIQFISVRKAVAAKLALLLPQVQSAEGAGLTDVELKAFREALYNCNSKMFGDHWYTDYVVAVLDVTSRVGDHRSLKLVERLARIEAKTDK